MRSSSAPCRINIATSAQKIDVDNRISLRIYYRIADNVLKQADIFREEKNIIDLYIMLLRFSSLVSETIPCHRDYRASQQSKKVYLKKKLLAAMNELEQLKPDVQQKINELDRKHTYKTNGWLSVDQNHSLEWPPVKRKTLTDSDVTKALRPGARELSWGSRTQQFSHAGPVAGHFRKMSLNFPRPKEETLSRHSILGPNGLQGQWQPPRNDKGVQYPSNIDITPVEIPSLHHSTENGVSVIKDSNNSEPHNLQHLEEHGFSEGSGGISNSEPEKSVLQLVITTNEDNRLCRAEEPGAMISFETTENPVKTDLVRQPSPPAVLAEVQDLIPAMSPQVTETENKLDFISPNEIVRSESPMQVHISTSMMESFMKLAKSNTNRNLETCGVLAGSLKNRKFYVTALIIPKQESTSDSCQTTNEEEIFEVQDKRSLFPLGWIHTHPTQSCFMSSIDVHTHYSYQIMLPEAVAIVMAPRDASRTHGIFRLTTPGGMSVIRNCQQRGFHPHNQPPGGGPIYKSCTDVYMNPNLKFDVIDLR